MNMTIRKGVFDILIRYIVFLDIEGWIIAMQQMCVGDKWEVYIPAEMGYGKFSQPGIPGGSTLIFEIELLSIA